MRPAESGPLEDLFCNPMGASLRALAFREGGIQGQVDDASQILFAPCRSKEPGSFGESGTLCFAKTSSHSIVSIRHPRATAARRIREGRPASSDLSAGHVLSRRTRDG